MTDNQQFLLLLKAFCLVPALAYSVAGVRDILVFTNGKYASLGTSVALVPAALWGIFYFLVHIG